MTNPYAWLFENPELILFYTAVVLILAAWAFASLRYTVRWVVLFREGMQRWRGDGLPDKKATNELALIMVTWALNLLLVGAFVYAVT